MSEMIATLEQTALSDYKYGFVTEIEADEAPLGLNEDIIRFISQKKAELDAHVDALSQSHERLLNYNPGPVGKLLCPRCWVVNGREHPVSIDPSPGRDDVLRCNACHQKFSVE